MPLILLAILLALAAPAGASSTSDYRAVHEDWQQDGKITPCYWTVEQLKHARDVADGNPDDTYNGFPDRVDAEIKRYKRGDCGARIIAVKPKRERVRLANRLSTTAHVGGMKLRDRQGHTIKIPRGTTIKPGGTITIKSKRRIWDDKGDVARLIAHRAVVSQFGYGRFKNTTQRF